jgi:hypothetical protein
MECRDADEVETISSIAVTVCDLSRMIMQSIFSSAARRLPIRESWKCSLSRRWAKNGLDLAHLGMAHWMPYPAQGLSQLTRALQSPAQR